MPCAVSGGSWTAPGKFGFPYETWSSLVRAALSAAETWRVAPCCQGLDSQGMDGASDPTPSCRYGDRCFGLGKGEIQVRVTRVRPL